MPSQRFVDTIESEDIGHPQIRFRAHRLATLFDCLCLQRSGRAFRMFLFAGSDKSFDEKPFKNDVRWRDVVAGNAIFQSFADRRRYSYGSQEAGPRHSSSEPGQHLVGKPFAGR